MSRGYSVRLTRTPQRAPRLFERPTWLGPEETLEWYEQVPLAPLRGFRVLAAGLIPLIAIAGGLWFTMIRPTGHITSGAVAFIAIAGLVVLSGAVNAVVRGSNRCWYVITDRRAAVLDGDGRIMEQGDVTSGEFFAQRDARKLSGLIHWGPSESGEEGAARGARWPDTRFGSLRRRTSTETPVLEFSSVSNLDVALAAARRVRAISGVTTPEALVPRSRRRPPVPLGFLDTRVAGVLNGGVLLLGGVALVVAIVLLVVVLLDASRPISIAPVLAIFGLVFPLSWWAVFLAQDRTVSPGNGRRRGQRITFDNLPPAVFVLVVAVFLASWAIGALCLSGNSLPGQPSFDAATGKYSADNHGTVIALTRAQYVKAVDAQNALFLSLEVSFLCLFAALGADEVARRRQSPFTARGPTRSPSP